MNEGKRQRNTSMDYSKVDSKRRLRWASDNLESSTNRYLVTRFENLPNELICEVFELLDSYYLYEIFFNLNLRLRNLCIQLNFPININISSLSKSTFQRYYTQFIEPNKHRIQSLHLSNPFAMDFFFSSTQDISKCSQLQTLILDTIESQYLENLLKILASLPNFSSLAIPISYSSNKDTIYNLIFELPVLKSCKISLEETLFFVPLPISTNKSSPIEHFIIDGKFNLVDINALLSYVPQLRRLSIKYLNNCYNQGMRVSSVSLNNLTHVSLTLNHVKFDQLEPFFKQYFGQVKLLHISSNYDHAYLNSSGWKRWILSYMPYLHIFDFQFTYEIRDGDKHENMYRTFYQQFTSPFWRQRQWFFARDYNSGGSLHGLFYSIQPYRRKYYTLTSDSILDKKTCHEKTVLDSVHHVTIQDERIISSCSKYFPNANELTISDQRTDRARRSVTDGFDHIIPLVQLTKMTIDYNHRPFSKVVDLLYCTPNVHTLVFKRVSLVSTDHFPLQQSEKFRLVSNQNKIKQLTVLFEYSLRNIQLFMKLCPKLQQLSIGKSDSHLESTLRFLLSETNRTTCHLSSICVFGVDGILIEKLKTLIESQKSINDYSIKSIDRVFFIWC